MTQEQSAEQQARDLLERLGYEDAQNRTAGDLVELANLIASTSSAAPPVPPTRVDELRDAASDLLACYGPASDYAEPYLTKWARLCSALAALASPVGETPARDDDKCPIDGGDTSDGACSICRITQAALVNMCHHCDEQPPDKLCWWCGRRGTGETPEGK